nr:aminotransferase class III-fold pyridoxal phosphate-dependent enzyme [Acidobacteriota bacterium]
MTTSLSPLKRALLKLEEMESRLETLKSEKRMPIAVIGMGCHFPGSNRDQEAFAELLRRGRCAIQEIPIQRWDLDAWYHPDPEAPGKMYCRHGGFIDQAYDFDASFFGISPREARAMDPQQRLLLETSWRALENALLNPAGLCGSRTGVFVGSSFVDHEAADTPASIDAYTSLGNYRSTAAGRISHILGFHGPNLQLDTACASSLMAVHLACQSLRTGESEIALAGGVNLLLSPQPSIGLCKMKALAVDGKVKVFDAAADGYVRGEGCGMVVLQPLEKALAAGQRVLAVIRGSATNHNGPSAGLTVPNRKAQEDLLRRALDSSGLRAGDIGYVEAHGSGTALGDPLEVGALAAVYGEGRNVDDPLWVGSLKANIGHLEAAAGIAGLIKTILVLQKEEIPPQIHFHKPNPHIPWAEIPLRVPDRLRAWPRGERPHGAAVTSMGISGSNVHLILEEAPEPAPTKPEPGPYLLTLSGKTPAALRALGDRCRDLLEKQGQAHPADICAAGRLVASGFRERLAITADSGEDLRRSLALFSENHTAPGLRRAGVDGRAGIAFAFPDGDPLRTGCGRELFENYPVFRHCLQRCSRRLSLDRPLVEVLYPSVQRGPQPLHPNYAEAARFSLALALAELWRSWGVVPDLVTGSGVQALAAACAAGLFSPEDGLDLVTACNDTQRFDRICDRAVFSQPRCRVVSAPEGPVPGDAIATSDWWRQWVRANDGTIRAFAPEPDISIIMEMGVGSVKTTRAVTRVLPCGLNGRRVLMENLAELYTAGAPIDWNAVSPRTSFNPVSFPGYPFERRTYMPVRTETEPAVTQAKPGDIYDAFAQEPGHAAGREKRRLMRFAPFPTIREGFSCFRFFTDPDEDGFTGIVQQGQEELREMLFRHVDFARCRHVFDFGCGYATDLIHLGTKHPHLHLTGCTLSREQENFACGKLEEAALTERVAVHLKDSAEVTFAERFELIFGIEVAHHIKDKARLLSNLTRHLADDGLLALADFVAATDFSIDQESLSSFLISKAEWLELFEKNGLGVLECVDVSREIANFLHDPDYEKHVDSLADQRVLPRVFHSYDRLGKLMRKGLVAYVLLTVKKCGEPAVAENRRKLEHMTPYSLLSPAHWYYKVTWQPKAPAGREPAAEQSASLQRGAAITVPLEEIALVSLAHALCTMGWSPRPGQEFSARRLQQQLGIIGRYEAYTGLLLQMLRKAGYLGREADTWSVLRELPRGESHRMTAELLERHPVMTHELLLLERITGALPEILRGETRALDLLFPDGDPETIGRLYHNALKLSGMDEVCCDVARKEISARRGPVRILEVGAGTGSLSACLLSHLHAARTSYCFTDISTHFVVEARERFRDFPFMSYAVLDLEREPAEQGFESHTYDIILAANAVHVTTSISATLTRLRRLLAPGGALILLEGIGRRCWSDLIFGLLDNWWDFRDRRLRRDHPLLDLPTWNKVLRRAGFARIDAFGDDSTDDTPAPMAVIRAGETPCPAYSGTWLILAGKHGPARALATLLRGRGELGLLVYPEQDAPCPDADDVVIDIHERNAFSRLVADLSATDHPPLKGVIHMWSLDRTPADRPDDAASMLCGSMFSLVHALAVHQTDRELSIYLVTRGAQQVAGNAVSAEGSPLWGLGTVLAREHPQWWGGLIDLDPKEAAGEAEALLAEMDASGGETRVALRNTGRYVARPAHVALDPVAEYAFHADATYMVTGGLGGLGRHVCRWMVSRGARHLLILGRSAENRNGRAFADALEEMGCRVTLRGVDVSDSEELGRVPADGLDPPLKGLIHAAGSLDDARLADLSRPRMAAVLAPKIQGCWNLHCLTRSMPLDFFVLFSSASVHLGIPGQAAYAAANAFMDALAQQRRQAGLPACSINWGPWSESGMAAGMADDRGSFKGLGRIRPGRGLEILNILLGRDDTGLMVLPADWDRFYQNVRDPFFAELIPPRVETRDSLGPVSAFPRGDRLETFVRERLRDLLQLDGPLDPQLGFREMGLDSFTSLELRNLLQRELGCSLPATLLFDSPTLPALLDRLRKQLEPGRDSETHSEEAVETAAAPRVVSNARALLQEPIAVVGLGCRFPGDAVSPEHFRRLLKEGRNGIIDLPDERWTRGSEAVADRGGFLRDIDLFDASFFSMSPQEADQLDPQHRLLLEVAWQTLEHAAVSPDRLQESNCGVFFGLATFDYASRVLSRNLEEVDAHTSSGAFAATAAGRLSHILGCRGPSMVVDTACSSSLVALHLACQSLRSGESELALAGGVNLMIDPRITSVFQRAGVISEDARCRCFDASANGIVRGEGCGVVLLERLSDARRNGDRILALVHGSAVNHDGRAGSLTAPSGTSQQIVMREALKRAGLKGSQIDYVETHGTGTRLGDPIEMGALGRVYGAERDTSRPLAVGSVKTNIGHLEAAAGIAGFIKTVLALHHGEIPPNLHFKQPSPHIAWDSLPIRVPVRAQPWPSGKQPRYAGVSSFGFSGTNAHVLLGEAPREAASGARCERPLHLLTLSARDERALAQLVDRYLEMPAGPAESSLGDLCFSANAGRAHFSHRIAVVGATWERMLQALDNLASGIPDACLFKGSPDGDHPPRVNLLIGNGQDWSWSGRLDHPGYRRDLDDFLAKSGTTRDGSDNPSRRFALLYSLVGLWRSWGIEPAHIAAHGLGEYVAACYAGVFSIEDALELLKARCRPSQDKDAPARAAGKIDFREPRISLTTPRGGRRIANSDYWTDPVGQSFDADRPLPMPDGPCLEIGTAAQPGWGELLHTLAGLYVRGIDPDWAAFDAPYRRRRVSLPTYPFQRQRYWLKDPEPLRQGLGSTGLPDPGKPEPGSVRQQEVLDQLVAIAARLLLVEKPRLDAPLLEMGADSLVMLSLKSKIKKVFGCEITTRQLAEQYRTLQALAGYIANRMPPPVEAPAAGDALNNRPGPNNRTSSSPQTLESIPRQQMQEIMNRQLQTIERVIDRQLAVLANAGTAGHDQASQPMPEPPAPGPVPGASIPRRTPAGTDVYSPQQRKHLDELITAYTRRTRTSKARAEEGRKHLADRRGSWGFRPSIKQLCYPIYAQSGKGCRITDLDGNEYIDLTMGFGAHFFGHEPEFLTKALEAGLKEGFRIGPRHDLADRVARQFSELTGMERVYFCSTGTEAVMTALRIARAAGGRTKAVVFQGSYHGHFDAALA